jgi:acetylornithine deacetylase/succinyl-diaminopimelate desuccinylase-like protein
MSRSASGDRIDAWVESEKARMLSELEEWLRIPSISSDPARSGECRRAAEWLAAHLRSLGCEAVELLGSRTHPVVYSDGPTAAGRPTVLVYGHYDVQPPEPLDEWTSPPFEPEVRDGRLYARGASDDKGQLFAIVKAFEAALGQPGDLGVNVRFLVEGEEESVGRVLSQVLADRPELIEADVVLVADGPFYAPGWPVIEIGVRGICYAEIVVRTLEGDLHSGLYGGVAPNALEVLVRLLAELKSEGGRIRIPGLYEAVARPSLRERQSWQRLPYSADRFRRQEVGARQLVGERRYSVHERLWARPTLDIHGIRGGFVGDGMKTVLPAEARAKVSLRLVPDQKADTVLAQLTRAVHEAAPEYADVDVRLLGGTDPALVDVSHGAFEHLERAFRQVVGRSPAYTRSGGSLPILASLGQAGAAVALAGIGLPDDRAHSPNERLDIGQFSIGVRTFARFFQSMASSDEKEKR